MGTDLGGNPQDPRPLLAMAKEDNLRVPLQLLAMEEVLLLAGNDHPGHRLLQDIIKAQALSTMIPTHALSHHHHCQRQADLLIIQLVPNRLLHLGHQQDMPQRWTLQW